MRENAKELIYKELWKRRKPCAVHEFEVRGVSQNAIATRLSEMQQEGRVLGTYREGTRFKEWIATGGRPSEKKFVKKV